MAESFKNIPIKTTMAGNQEHAEIKSCAEAEPYALRVIGDSMAPEFVDGHILIVDPALPPQHGAYVIIDYQGETTFRQFIVENDKKFLRALNDAYPVVELVEKYSVRGVVVQRASCRRKDHKHYY
ncbi:MAG: S24 family peptidase [Gammaproteobacteria bacterium]|nr:S24 family peptidase [Gammaproteobacteria bacterium]MDH3370602.1 S24 family peptidase [Gammaproteobacteria bacterium]MDH3405304.1 S24 family peptidase [Gammaproteobacteria bacterium]MDH3562277.1 S24 family peptidase [Gammaproteobacteria bacterium]MDH5487139.1 S24 family peptidase [Gammaproteobacteria bacterium]